MCELGEHWLSQLDESACKAAPIDTKINGDGNYGFQISAIDEKLTPSTDVDLFRMRIWDKDNGDTLVYDNKVDESDPNADPATTIGGGSITIHKK